MPSEDLGRVAETLLTYVREKTTFQTDRVVTVPFSTFTNEQRWQKEMDLIFKRVPLCLAASAELREPGSYKAMEAAGLPVLITRDADRKVHAFLNVCAHRGAVLVGEGCGEQKRFACRYHGWTYGNDGRLIGVADPKKFGDIDKSKRGLRALPCEERAGMIFVVLTPGLALDLDDFYRGMLDDFEHIGFEDWAYLGQRVIQGANWKVAFDGYLEGYHFASLHPQTIHPRTYSNITHYEAYGPHLRIGFPQVGIEEQLGNAPREQWGEMENRGYDMVRILFPNVSVFVAPEITQVAQLFPGPTPDRNRTVLSFFRREGPRDNEDRQTLEGMMDWLRDVVLNEDYWIGDLIQKGLESQAYEDVVYGKNERGNQFFHEYVDWYLEERPDAPRPRL